MNNKVGLLRFGAVGIVNTLIDFAVFITLVRYFEWTMLLANAVSYMIAVSNSYVLNFIWTFRQYESARISVNSYVIFVVINALGLVISSLVIWTLQSVVIAEVAKLMAVAVTLMWSFFATKYFVMERGKLSE